MAVNDKLLKCTSVLPLPLTAAVTSVLVTVPDFIEIDTLQLSKLILSVFVKSNMPPSTLDATMSMSLIVILLLPPDATKVPLTFILVPEPMPSNTTFLLLNDIAFLME